jgi:hypothetical protein
MRRKWQTNQKHTGRGFAIPIALGLGLAMILVGLTLIFRSQSDQVLADSQKLAAQSVAVTEAGISRSMSLLNRPQNALLLKLNYDSINPVTGKTYLGPDGKLNTGDEEATLVDEWTGAPFQTNSCSSGSLPPDLIGDVSSGKIQAYRYNPDPDGNPATDDETGYLLVEGQKNTTAASRVLVALPIKDIPDLSIPFPGLYASESINLGNDDVKKLSSELGQNANVVCKLCSFTPNATNCQNGKPTQIGLNTAISRGTNSVIEGRIAITDPKLQPVPIPPTTLCSTSSGPNCYFNLDTPPLLGSITELPRKVDKDVGGKWPSGSVYQYKVTDIDLNKNALNINTSTAPVYLYVSGNIDSGKGFTHSGDSSQFRIFGNPEDPTNLYPDQTFTINGDLTHVFIYAPDAAVKVESPGVDIQGAVWVKSWNSSNPSNNTQITVPDAMNDDLLALFNPLKPRSLPLSRWQRQPILTQ